MTTTRLSGTLALAGRTLDALPVITLDRGWAPYISAEVTVPFDQDLFDDTDPRAADLRGVLTVRQDWYESRTLDDLSAEWAGKTLDDLSAEWAGKTLDDLSDLWGDRWGNDGWRPPLTRTFDLALRTREADYVAGTITYGFASDELLTQERPGESPATLASDVLTQVTTHLRDAFGYGVGDFTFDPGPWGSTPLGLNTFRPEDLVWQRLASTLAEVGLHPWVDEHRVWRLSAPDDPPVGSIHLPRVIEAKDRTSRDGEWASHIRVVTRYAYADGTPAVTASHEAGAGDAWRVVVKDYGPQPSAPVIPGLDPDALLARAQAHGRSLALVAPIDLAAAPRQTITTGLPSLPSLAGMVETIRFDLPAGQMTLTTTDTVTGA